MRRRTFEPPTLRCTTWRIVSSLSVRRESGCVRAPHAVTPCVPADASAGTSAAAARAAAAYLWTLIVLPLRRGGGQGEDERPGVGAGPERLVGPDRLRERDRGGPVGHRSVPCVGRDRHAQRLRERERAVGHPA